MTILLIINNIIDGNNVDDNDVDDNILANIVVDDIFLATIFFGDNINVIDGNFFYDNMTNTKVLHPYFTLSNTHFEKKYRILSQF